MSTNWEVEGILFLRKKNKKLAIIIPCMNEESTISAVIQQAKKLNPDSLIVVVNGSSDRTAELARNEGAEVIEYDYPLGNDVGRAIGAMHAKADIYLFLDGDLVIPAEDLYPFVEDIENGADMALNSIDWVARFPAPHAPAIARHFINIVQGRRDLGLENVLTVPHAFSRRALDLIGKHTLAIPQLANAKVLERNLKVTVSNNINVLAINKKRDNHIAKAGELMPKAYDRMHGDTVEALWYLIGRTDRRGGYSQGNRKRKTYSRRHAYTRDWKAKRPAESSIVLSVTQNAVYLRQLLEQLIQYDIELIPIVHDASPQVIQIFKRYQIPFIEIPHFIGHDVAFAIGSELATGRNIVFHDTTIPIDSLSFIPFLQHLKHGQADITLNDHSRYLGKLEGMHAAHIGNCFVNIMARKNDLSASSMLLPPYGMNRNALERIGSFVLMSPCVAHLRALHLGLKVKPVVEIDYHERINETLKPIVLNQDRIIGDFMEGIYYWTQLFGKRGGFHDGDRIRSVLNNDWMMNEPVKNIQTPGLESLYWILE